MNFTTFTEEEDYWAGGTVFVIALVDRDTLRLKGYVNDAFLTEDDAEEYLDTSQTDNSIAYVIQEKAVTGILHTGREE